VSFFISALVEISKLLNTGLDAETLAICVRLCENGINPEALALVIQELRRETATYRVKYSILCHLNLG
jgi:mitotic-spindle organizing protein 1